MYFPTGQKSKFLSLPSDVRSIGGDSSQRIFGGEIDVLNCQPGKKENGFYLTGTGKDDVIYFNGSRAGKTIDGFVPFPIWDDSNNKSSEAASVLTNSNSIHLFIWAKDRRKTSGT